MCRSHASFGAMRVGAFHRRSPGDPSSRPVFRSLVPNPDLMAGSESGETKPDVSSYAPDHQQLRAFRLTPEEPHPNTFPR